MLMGQTAAGSNRTDTVPSGTKHWPEASVTMLSTVTPRVEGSLAPHDFLDRILPKDMGLDKHLVRAFLPPKFSTYRWCLRLPCPGWPTGWPEHAVSPKRPEIRAIAAKPKGGAPSPNERFGARSVDRDRPATTPFC
jgi:hypothetical protein